MSYMKNMNIMETMITYIEDNKRNNISYAKTLEYLQECLYTLKKEYEELIKEENGRVN